MVTDTVTERMVSLALVHHANQYVITNGYKNRDGIDALVGTSESSTGYLKILELHKAFQIPLNLHVTGTLLEALLWYRPDFLEAVQQLEQQGLVELIGSSYGQNIMRFFTYEHNLKQLNEELKLYRDHLKVDPRRIKVFSSPERVWDTENLAPVLTDPRLLNGGYQYVLIDDRLLYPTENGSLSRWAFDQGQERRFENFAPHRILHGQGLIALPISTTLRQNIPPRDTICWQATEERLRWLSEAVPHTQGDLIAVYADDLEKAAGAGWDARGPSQFEAFLTWVSKSPWIRAVNLSEWMSTHRVAGETRIEVGAYVELTNHFGAGEGYEKWYLDPQWGPYRSYYEWSEGRVKTLSMLGADPALTDLAWKHLL